MRATQVRVEGRHKVVTFFSKDGQFMLREVRALNATHYLIQKGPPAFVVLLTDSREMVADAPEHYAPPMREFMRRYIRERMARGYEVLPAHERVRINDVAVESVLTKAGRPVSPGYHYVNEEGPK